MTKTLRYMYLPDENRTAKNSVKNENFAAAGAPEKTLSYSFFPVKSLITFYSF